MQYSDLRDFVSQLEASGELKRIAAEVSPRLEMTEICDRVLRAGGPALLFERPAGHDIPVLANLSAPCARIAAAMGLADTRALREVGKMLAFLREPKPPKRLRDLWDSLYGSSSSICRPSGVEGALPGERPRGKDVDLAPAGADVLAARRGSAHHLGPDGDARSGQAAPEPRHLSSAGARPRPRDHALARAARRRARFSRSRRSVQPFPVAVALGADPATMLAAARRRSRMRCRSTSSRDYCAGAPEPSSVSAAASKVPASAEIVLEGDHPPVGYRGRGPHGDHTGYYNEVERFPVMTVQRITMRRSPIYHSTYTGKPPASPPCSVSR